MQAYVLSGIKDGVLSCVELFDTYTLAFESGKKLANSWGVPNYTILARRADRMDGWVIADVPDGGLHTFSPSVFVSIVIRDIESKFLPTHSDIGKQIFGTHAPVPAPPSPPDNPFDPNLPGGFNWTGKPLLIKDVQAHAIDVKDTYSLTENQKWALIIARVSKRPNFLILPSVGLYSQKYALEELKKKTTIGLDIRDKELCKLQDFYDSLKEDSYDEEPSSEDDDG